MLSMLIMRSTIWVSKDLPNLQVAILAGLRETELVGLITIQSFCGAEPPQKLG
jgi:hypothetical protein